MRNRSLLSLAAPSLFLLLPVYAMAQAPSASVAPAASPSASAVAPAGSAQNAGDVATRIQKVYESITSFEADFEQKYSLKAYNEEKTSKGHVLFKKGADPKKNNGKMRWDYTEPKDNVVVSDGTMLWSYVASDKQARRMPVVNSLNITALSFLTGKGNLQADFDLKLLDAAKLKFPGGYVLEARPKAPTNLYSFVLFYVDAGTWQVRRVLIVDAQDNRNRFDFTKPVVNGKVDEGRFTWTPPPGVNVSTD